MENGLIFQEMLILMCQGVLNLKKLTFLYAIFNTVENRTLN